MVNFTAKITKNPNTDEKVVEYFSEFEERINSSNLIKNPFIGESWCKQTPEFFYYNISMRPVWPTGELFGAMLLCVLLIFTGLTWWLILPGLMIFSGIFKTPFPYYYGFKLGLRKKIKGVVVEWLDYEDFILLLKNGGV